MEEVRLKLNEKNLGHFYISHDNETVSEMEVGVSGNVLTIYHTEVLPKAEGKGLAKKILETAVQYARTNGLKIAALCPYAHAQFKRHQEEYADVWNKSKED